MIQVFVSYAREDLETVKHLAAVLKKHQIDALYDLVEIMPSERWREAIEPIIEEAACVIVAITKASLQSPFVIYECAYAYGFGLPIVPIFFGDREEINTLLAVHPLGAFHGDNDFSEGVTETTVRAIEHHARNNPVAKYADRIFATYWLPLSILLSPLSLLELAFRLSRQPVLIELSLLLITEIQKEQNRLTSSVLPDFLLTRYSALARKQRQDFTIMLRRLEALKPDVARIWGAISELQYHLGNGNTDFDQSKMQNELAVLSSNWGSIELQLKAMASNETYSAYQQFSNSLKEVFRILPLSEYIKGIDLKDYLVQTFMWGRDYLSSEQFEIIKLIIDNIAIQMVRPSTNPRSA